MRSQEYPNWFEYGRLRPNSDRIHLSEKSSDRRAQGFGRNIQSEKLSERSAHNFGWRCACTTNVHKNLVLFYDRFPTKYVGRCFFDQNIGQKLVPTDVHTYSVGNFWSG